MSISGWRECLQCWIILFLCNAMCVGEKEMTGKRKRDYSFSWASPVCLTRPSWWNQDEIPCACRSTLVYSPGRSSVFLWCWILQLKMYYANAKENTLNGWVNNYICSLHTWGLISHSTQDKAEGSGDLVAKQLLMIQTLFYTYDEKRLKPDRYLRDWGTLHNFWLCEKVIFISVPDPEIWKHSN